MTKVNRILLFVFFIFLFLGCSAVNRERPEDLRRKAMDHSGRGERLEREGEYILAIQEFLEAEKLSPRPAVYYHLGHCYLKIDEPGRAEDYLSRALKMAPDYREAQIELALARKARRKPSAPGTSPGEKSPLPKARTTSAPVTETRIASSSHVNKSRTTSRAKTINLPLPGETRDKMVKTDETEIKDLPPMSEVKKALFPRLYNQREKAAIEEEQVKRYIDRKKKSLDDFSFHLDKARHYREYQEYGTAVMEYRDALKARPDSLEALTELASVYRLLGSEERAETLFTQSRAKFSQSPRFFLKWGNFYLNLNRLSQADEKYHKALQLSPRYLSALNNMGIVSLRKEDYQKALEYFQSTVEIDPKFASGHLNLGIIYDDHLDDPEKARKHYKTYLDLQGERADEVSKWLKDLEP